MSPSGPGTRYTVAGAGPAARPLAASQVAIAAPASTRFRELGEFVRASPDACPRLGAVRRSEPPIAIIAVITNGHHAAGRSGGGSQIISRPVVAIRPISTSRARA